MPPEFAKRRQFSNAFRVVAVLLGLLGYAAGPASADRTTFRVYNADQGLGSLGGTCMIQDETGYILVCTEHGVFSYDGRQFVNLGPEQGLRQGGDVFGLALTSGGRVAIGFADQIAIAQRPTDAAHPPSALSFQTVLHPGVSFYNAKGNRLAAWRSGLAFLAGEETERIVVPNGAQPFVETMGYDDGEGELLKGAEAIFSVANHLWETFNDGRLCAADPGSVRCYGAADGLTGGSWLSVIDGPGHKVMARSASSVATLDPQSGKWSIVALPDQGGRYMNYVAELSLFKTADGGLVSQADHGLVVLGPDGWRQITVDDGAPSGIIVSAMTDANGQFWFQILGRGLVRWVGYGHWETFQKSEGLSDGIPWMTARAPGGPLWIATDTAVDEVIRSGRSLKVSRIFPGGAFAVAVGPHGELWRSSEEGARAIDPATGATTSVSVPLVNAIASDPAGTVWLATKAGLMRVDDRTGHPLTTTQEGLSRTEIVDVICDGHGGAYYLAGGRLRHWRREGDDVVVNGPWPDGGFDPLVLALGAKDEMWLGGAGGLYRFRVQGDTIKAVTPVATSDTRTNSIVAVMVDHRGWVWAGTSEGVSVFNGERWVSADADQGLVSDDVDQGGLREDPDGSVWIVTSQGVSHLLDPASLFEDHPIKVVFSSVFLGARPVVGQTLPYTTDALTVQFGAPNSGSERSFVFRYQLSGVDSDWAVSSGSVVRYASVPPGHHTLTVIGYDQLTHSASAPAQLEVDIAYPWWRQWWAEIPIAFAAIGFVYCAMLLRFRAIMARHAELQRHVDRATAQLRYQAAHDSLTGLFNRSEIERRLAAKLSSEAGADEMIVALMDIDHFKRVNDNYGHLGGDEVLRAIGRLIGTAMREGDYAGRYGGEEILLVLSDADGRAAERVLNLHHTIRGGTFNAAGSAIHVTCSIGLAWAISGDNWESLIARADDALYDAKAAGRDTVVESGREGKTGRQTETVRRPGPSASGRNA